ncbi:MAG: thioredoxin [Syntrophobacterales bacterium]|nr:thioredoxin [Syntrophobacterales bacterium]
MSKEDLLVHVNDSNFEEEVIKSAKAVLIDLWAPWCGPCLAIAPIVEELAEEYKDKIKVVKLNVDESPATATAYGIRSIPTLMLFKDGKPQDTLIGLVPKERLEEFIKKVL